MLQVIFSTSNPGIRLAMDVIYLHKVMKELHASQIKIHPPFLKDEIITIVSECVL
jgi:hypothetical protein